MASSSPDSSPPSLEVLSFRGAAAALFIPLIIAMDHPPEISVFVHPTTGSMTVFEGALDAESLGEFPFKQGSIPATKASIDSLPRVQLSEAGLECSICLEEYEVNIGVEVKRMPCDHKFHAECIDKWLAIRGSCPVCRFSMPVEEENRESYESGGVRIHMYIFQQTDDVGPGSGVSGAGTGRDDNMPSGHDNVGDDELAVEDMY